MSSHHLCLDIGNVLASVKLDNFTKEFQKYFSDQDPMLFLNNLWGMQDIGLSTIDRALQVQYGIRDSVLIDNLLAAWNTTVIPNAMMLNFMDNLRDQDVKIALLSNMGPEHATYLRKTCSNMFKDTVEHISCEVGARKPNKLFFQSFLLDHPEWVGAVYVDDRDENLAAGKKYSLRSFKFDLEYILQQSKAKQKLELDKIKSYIFDHKYDK